MNWSSPSKCKKYSVKLEMVNVLHDMNKYEVDVLLIA